MIFPLLLYKTQEMLNFYFQKPWNIICLWVNPLILGSKLKDIKEGMDYPRPLGHNFWWIKDSDPKKKYDAKRKKKRMDFDPGFSHLHWRNVGHPEKGVTLFDADGTEMLNWNLSWNQDHMFFASLANILLFLHTKLCPMPWSPSL